MLIIINFIFSVLGAINLCLCLYDLMINDYEAMFIPFLLMTVSFVVVFICRRKEH
ncbi:MAG: hypothetical protein ACI4WM_03350 [Erysipelotrichaceae bacterium]